MNKLICTFGLPRSGKTTWIKKNDIKAPIVSPDAIRLALHGQRYIPEAEDMVWAMAKIMVRSLFKAGHNIVFVDATNNTKKQRDFWQNKEWTTFFKVFDASVQECVERAKKMDDLIILPVIERVAAQFEPLESAEKIFGAGNYEFNVGTCAWVQIQNSSDKCIQDDPDIPKEIGKLFEKEKKEESFRKELRSLINRYSKENGSDTPDFILADYLNGCFSVYDETVNRRERWFGRGIINPIDGSNKETGQINL